MTKNMRWAVLIVCACLARGALARDWTEYLTGFFKRTAAESRTPWFCHDLDCPEYELVEQIDDIELRRYSKSMWASTVVQEAKYEPAVYQGFKRLFNYIAGDNQDGAKVEMTAPVRTMIYPSQGPFCANNFTVSFMVPFSLQDDGPPEPSSADVFIEEAPELEVYVSSFGGYASERDVLAKARELVQKLDAANRSYGSSHYYSAGYDSPFRLVGRHNEVWVLANSGKGQL